MSNWLSGLMGKATAPPQAQSVSTLLERVQNASTPQDRRKALLDLRNMADNPIHVKSIGTEGIATLMKRVANDKADVDTLRGIVQLLISIMSIPSSELRTVPLGSPQYENIMRFVKDPHNAAIILSLLEENDRNIRYYSTKLLTYLLANRCAEIEAAVLQSPAHITRLMDLLKLGEEMIRNEALLLLIEISKTNVELQKVIAFENGFENLLTIIEAEGLSNGGIVVQDCLTLINNLLSANTSNQNHFREMGCIKRLSELLKLESSDYWTISDDKRDNILLSLNAIASLLSSPASIPVTQSLIASASTSNPQLPSTSVLIPSNSIQSTQSQLGAHRVLARVIELALSSIKAPIVRIKALWVLGDLIYCHTENRTFLEQHDFKVTTGSGRVSALLKVTQTAFSQVPMESLAAFHVLRCYFQDNPSGQRLFAATIAPPTATSSHHDETYPARIIVNQLLSWESNRDPAKVFFAAMGLSYILASNNGVKEQLLKIPFETPVPGVPIENLLSKLAKWTSRAVQVNSELPVIVAFLRCLSTWIADCPLAANQFRSNSSNIAFLANLITQTSPSPHISGLAAYLYGLALDPTTQSEPNALENQAAYRHSLECLRSSPEFLRAEQGGSRQEGEEAQLSFYDTAFILSFLRVTSLHTVNPKLSVAPISSPMAHVPSSNATAGPSTPTLPTQQTLPTAAPAPLPLSSAPSPNSPNLSNGIHTTIGPKSIHTVPNGGPNGVHTPTIPIAPIGHSFPSSEVEVLKSQLFALTQEKQVWMHERKNFELNLHQSQSHIHSLQTQLQSMSKQNELLVQQLAQVSTQVTTQLVDASLQKQFDELKAEHVELEAAHDDLLILLAETQEENESLKASRAAAPKGEEDTELL